MIDLKALGLSDHLAERSRILNEAPAVVGGEFITYWARPIGNKFAANNGRGLVENTASFGEVVGEPKGFEVDHLSFGSGSYRLVWHDG